VLTGANISSTNFLLMPHKDKPPFNSDDVAASKIFKGAHTRKSLARESDSARVAMSQTPPCMGCKVGSQLMRFLVEINPSPAPESSSPSQTRTYMGPLRQSLHVYKLHEDSSNTQNDKEKGRQDLRLTGHTELGNSDGALR
jgi:hypothetical protein